jgi:hypothetical protein
MSQVPTAVRVLLPPGSVVFGPGDSDPVDKVAELAPGGRVALADCRVGSGRRLRRRARRLGLDVHAEYVVLPTWSQATFVVEADQDTVAWLLTTLGTVPPGVRHGARLVDLLVRGATVTPWLHRAVAALAPGRLLVGVPR